MSHKGFAFALFVVWGLGCNANVTDGGAGEGQGGGAPSSSSSSTPPTVLTPNPKNPDGCPSTMPTVGTSCTGSSQEGFGCSYLGDQCAEWLYCSASDCPGSTGVTGGGGWYDEYPCDYTWIAMPGHEIPRCNPVDCQEASDGDPCAVEGQTCEPSSECNYQKNTCANGTWSVEMSVGNCCYDCCDDDCWGQTTGAGGYGGGAGGAG